MNIEEFIKGFAERKPQLTAAEVDSAISNICRGVGFAPPKKIEVESALDQISAKAERAKAKLAVLNEAAR